MSRVTQPPIDRRTVLRGGLVAGVAVAGAGVVGLAGCSTGPSEETLLAESLTPLVRSALADEATARGLAAVESGYAAALTVVADQRARHARAVREEITRLDQEVAASIDKTPATSAPPAPAPTLERLRADLGASGEQAHDIAITTAGYPAGLAGSIAAAVTSMREVQLA
ncbi:hypothetical protein GDN83_00260 [Gordonia jinghuaiqii]|uniref:Uncharacterized protein n=1 Tax=Gordonia jinghuaiqii TaxID=2758710 RepID=A0A7D7LU19_9ACTN|nr:hypothetical protein [Gordonia jinghuaiqii]MCR5976207.1 hypothetical protein [Gordonia jinghuaiqii]QMT03443.1 hypothetical protein H1R19_10345 [Gordonia jinghuaiqii]